MAATTTTDRTDSRETRVEDRLADLFDAHHERLHRLALRLSRDTEGARDLVQETFLRAARRVSTVPDGASSEEAWLVRVLVNVCRDVNRRKRVRGIVKPVTDADLTTGGFENAIVARATVRKALAMLSARGRAVLVLHSLEERPVAEVAKLLGVSRVTVRWHLATARRRLAIWLKPPQERQEHEE